MHSHLCTRSLMSSWDPCIIGGGTASRKFPRRVAASQTSDCSPSFVAGCNDTKRNFVNHFVGHLLEGPHIFCTPENSTSS